MADEKVTTKKKKLSEDVILNRRINYTIIKILWSLREDQAKISQFHEYIGIKRDRYRCIIMPNKSRTPRLKGITQGLSSKSDISQAIFVGERAFSITGIEKAEWSKYFSLIDVFLRDTKQKDSVGFKGAKEYKIKHENKVIEKIKEDVTKLNVDKNLYNAYQYFTKSDLLNNPIGEAEKIKKLIEGMQREKVDQLEQLTTDVLTEYRDELKKQLYMVSTLCEYRNLKNFIRK